jgi:ribose-phosphate pyrophosphokinase
MADIRLFALEGSRHLGEGVAAALDVELAAHEERPFEDGEHKSRPLFDVRDADVYVIHSLHGDREQSANDRLCRLLFFIGALRDAGAARVTALAPYLCYSRKDRRTKARDPVTTRYVATLFEAVGTSRIATIDVHNVAAFENAFRIPAENLSARPLFASLVAERLAGKEIAVFSPDAGGLKRARALQEELQEHRADVVPLLHQEAVGKRDPTVAGDRDDPEDRSFPFPGCTGT